MSLVPLVVRIGGLPANVLAPPGGDRCLRLAAHLQALEEEVRTHRQALVDALHQAVHEAPAAQRRILLELKRDSFNGRSLRRHRAAPGWDQLVERVGPALVVVLSLEEQLAEQAAAFERAWQEQWTAEGEGLALLAADRGFLRGVALSSPVVAESLERLAEPSSGARRRRRLDLALLRYASRAAVKLSPFSSLTKVGLGAIVDTGETLDFQLVEGGAWRERSCSRLQRFLADQFLDVLARCRPFRESLPVVLNSSLEACAKDRYRFVRPGSWSPDPSGERLSYNQPALVQATLRGPVIDWIVQRTAGAGEPYGRLVAELASAFPAEDAAGLRGTVDRLVDLGVLCFVWPFTASDIQWEVALLAHLEALARPGGHEELGALDGALRQILDLLDAYASAGSPAQSVVEIRRKVREALGKLALLGGLDPRIAAFESKERFFYEDVFLASDRPPGAIVRLARSRAAGIAGTLQPLVDLSTLYSGRRELLSTLAAFAAERWPGRTEIGFLELFEAAFPLFREYLRLRNEVRSHAVRRPAVFNPLELPAIESIRKSRELVADRLDGCLTPAGDSCDEWQVDAGSLQALLADLPGACTPARDFCAFIQPLDGRRWVLNSLAEGLGRMSSRYTSAMDEDMRRFFASSFVHGSVAATEEGRVELVDLFCPVGNTANVHAPHTRRVFELPGHPPGLPAGRCLLLGRLTVRLRGAQELPELVDDEGTRILPVHLGALVYRLLPTLLKFLVQFGPGEISKFAPFKRRWRRDEDVRAAGRQWIGDLILRRKAWLVAPESLRVGLRGSAPAAAFAALNRWRLARGIPERIFLTEQLDDGLRKPQYIDFTSCRFVELFRSILDEAAGEIEIVEALPDPGDLPATAGGERWAVELQLESSALGVPRRATPSSVEEFA
jgi:Lantibiotic dehydratase, N terminus